MIIPRCKGIISVDGAYRNQLTAFLTVRQEFDDRIMLTQFSPMKYTFDDSEEGYNTAFQDMRLDLEDNMKYAGMTDAEIEESIKVLF